jgi:hypothetical protein
VYDANVFSTNNRTRSVAIRKHRRKPKYDWVEAELFVNQRWEQWGDPCDDQNQRDGWRSDSDIAKHVLEHLAKLAPDIEPPDLSTVRKWLRPGARR